jgi:hypothetical protein
MHWENILGECRRENEKALYAFVPRLRRRFLSGASSVAGFKPDSRGA